METQFFELKNIQSELGKITAKIESYKKPEYLKQCFGFIDLTTLNSSDTQAKGKQFAENVNSFPATYKDMPNVAAICVYPSLVETVRKNLNIKSVKIAAVAAGFPSSQTFIEVKTLETSLTVQKGADEIDIVISLGTFLEGNYKKVGEEIEAIKKACGNAHLKVILESGSLPGPEAVYKASMISMEAGADFIKTSTGKTDPPATPEAVFVMCHAIKDYFAKTGKKIGLKPAGGIVTATDALTYYLIVKEILGQDWLTPEWFRLGASKLANNLVHDIILMETGQDKPVSHF